MIDMDNKVSEHTKSKDPYVLIGRKIKAIIITLPIYLILELINFTKTTSDVIK